MYITTFKHVNGTINESIMYLHNFKNNDIQVIRQLKNYKNSTEYRNNTTLIEKTLTDEKNVTIQFTEIKYFLKEHNDLKVKPTKKEKLIWWTITIISLSIIILTPIITFALPALIPATAAVLLIDTKLIITVCSAAIGAVFNRFTSIFSDAIRKVESWWCNKLWKNKEKKKKKKSMSINN